MILVSGSGSVIAGSLSARRRWPLWFAAPAVMAAVSGMADFGTFSEPVILVVTVAISLILSRLVQKGRRMPAYRKK
jgi:hypothetical protein